MPKATSETSPTSSRTCARTPVLRSPTESTLTINAPEGSEMASAIAEYADYITNETLAVGINGEMANEVARVRHNLDGVEVEIGLVKV